MRGLLLLIAIFFALHSFGQAGHVKVFKKTVYINGNFYRETNDTINTAKEEIDIYFYKRHFNLPYYIPEKFIEKRYRNQKISVWRDPGGKKNFQNNWVNTYTYDSQGLVTNYASSSCLICSYLPYNYTVVYNSTEQVERIFDTTNTADFFKLFYNAGGKLKKVEKYSQHTLDTEIELVN